jgi:hypothetical protein
MAMVKVKVKVMALGCTAKGNMTPSLDLGKAATAAIMVGAGANLPMEGPGIVNTTGEIPLDKGKGKGKGKDTEIPLTVLIMAASKVRH